MSNKNNISSFENQSLYKNIGNVIRIIRIYRGETPESMAHKIGLKDPSGYYKLERGNCQTIDFKRLIEICKILNISPLLMLCLMDFDVINFDPNSLEEYIRIIEYCIGKENTKPPNIEVLLKLYNDNNANHSTKIKLKLIEEKMIELKKELELLKKLY
jgi:transcriptional regulator with XRE-family HTH domain